MAKYELESNVKDERFEFKPGEIYVGREDGYNKGMVGVYIAPSNGNHSRIQFICSDRKATSVICANWRELQPGEKIVIMGD